MHMILIKGWIETPIYLNLVIDPFLQGYDLLLFVNVLLSQLHLGGLHTSLLFHVNY